MPHGRVMRSGAGGLTVVAFVSACGIRKRESRDFCTQYRQFQKPASALRQLNPDTASVADVRAKIVDSDESVDPAEIERLVVAQALLIQNLADARQG